MKKSVFILAVCLCVLLSESTLQADPGGYLSSTTYSLTTNSATRTIIVTNFVQAGSSNFEWYPAAIMLNNRGATTGELLRVEHLRTGVSNIMQTNGAFTVTNLLISINSASGDSTNWVAAARWYVVPLADQLRITTVVTNGEIILNREVAR